MIIFEILVAIFLLGFIFWVCSHLYSTIFYVPYVNSSNQAISEALGLTELKKNELFLDLGCGSGDALIIAARDFGATAIGYEISPLPYLLAKIKTRKYSNIQIFRSDFRKSTKYIKQADVIYMYLLNSVLNKIENQIFHNIKGNTRIATLAFKFKTRKPSKVIKTKNLGIESSIFLYKKLRT